MTTLLERFDALCSAVSGLDDAAREQAVRDFLANEKRVEEQERDPEGLLQLFVLWEATQADKVQDAVKRLRTAGFTCRLTRDADGPYERVMLAYGRPGAEPGYLYAGWHIDEAENQSRELTLLWLAAKTLADSAE